MVDAAHYLGVHDADLIYSWTPREFKNFVKGARLREIDAYELSATSALFIARAQNSKKKVGVKDLFDAKQARKRIDSVDGEKENERDLTYYRRAKAAMNNWSAQTSKKGGN